MLTAEQLNSLDSAISPSMMGADVHTKNAKRLAEWRNAAKQKQDMLDTQNQQPVAPAQPQTIQGIGQQFMNGVKKVGNFLTSNEQAFGQTLGNSFAYMSGTGKKLDDADKVITDAGDQLMQQAMHATDPAKRAKYINLARKTYENAGISYKDVLPFIEKSAIQVLGEGAGVFLDIAASGSYGKAAEGAKSFQLTVKVPSAATAVANAAKNEAVGFIPGAIQGAKAAIPAGAAIGGAYGIAQGAQNSDLKFNQPETYAGGVGKILVSGVEGAAIGGATAGLLGGVVGGTKGAINKHNIKETQKALNNIVPTPKELSASEYQDMLRKGRVTPKGKFGGSKIIPSKDELQVAEKYGKMLQSNDPVKNAGNVLNVIKQKDDEVGKYLSTNTGTFNENQLRKKLMDGIADVNDIYIPNDKSLQKAKEGYVNSLISEIKSRAEKSGKSPFSLYGVWDGRKSFDQVADRTLKAFDGSPTLKKDIIRGVRNSAQEFITEKLGNNNYSSKMAEMSQLYKVLDMIETKATKEKGVSALAGWITRHPVQAKTLGWIAAGIGLGTVGKTVTNVVNASN